MLIMSVSWLQLMLVTVNHNWQIQNILASH